MNFPFLQHTKQTIIIIATTATTTSNKKEKKRKKIMLIRKRLKKERINSYLKLFVGILLLLILLPIKIDGFILVENHHQVINDYHHHHYSLSVLLSAPSYDVTETENRVRQQKQQVFPMGAFGPPDPLHNLKVGDTIQAFRRKRKTTINDKNPTSLFTNQDITIQRISKIPNIFVLKNFLTSEECYKIKMSALQQQQNNNSMMKPAETISASGQNTARTKCYVAWLSPSSNKDGISNTIVSEIISSVANLLVSPTLKEAAATSGMLNLSIEDMQVLRYDIGGEFVLHHDGPPRILTVIFYLNDVAGTWFPLATSTTTKTTINDDDDSKRSISVTEQYLQSITTTTTTNKRLENYNNNNDTTKIPINHEQAIEACKNLIPGQDGVLVLADDNNWSKNKNTNVIPIQRGDAVAFYNYMDDGSGKIDWRAIHAGLPAQKNEKWIANLWIRS